MAVLVQSEEAVSSIREALSSLALPDGIRLNKVYVGENSHGEQAVFIIYAEEESSQPLETRAKEIRGVTDATLRALDPLNLPLFTYVHFIAA